MVIKMSRNKITTNNENTIVTLKKGEGRTLKSGGMWVYDNEIDSILGSFEDGDIITVHDFDGYFMGYGFINTNSKITIRVLSRRKENFITEEFIEQRVRNAWEYRKQTVDTGCCRVIFGEAEAPVHAPDPAMAERRLGFYLRNGLRIAGYDTDIFGVHYKTLYLYDREVSDEDLMEAHRYIYQDGFTPEKYARHIVIPRDPNLPPIPQIPWDQ